MRFNFSQLIVINFWRYLRLSQVLILMLLVYLAFYLVTLYRLHDPKLAVRMEFVALLLKLTLDDKKTARTGALPEERAPALTLERFRNWTKKVDFRFYASSYDDLKQSTSNEKELEERSQKVLFQNGLPKRASREAEENFYNRVRDLAAALDANDDARITDILRDLRPELLRWFPHGEFPRENPSWWSRFFRSDFRTKGIDLADPAGGLKDWKVKAHNYLEYRNVVGPFRDTPFDIQTLPWELIRFFDATRCDLNNGLPIAFGTVLMACNLLLRSRLIDRKLNTLKQEPKEARAEQLGPKISDWVKIWSDGGEKMPPLLGRFALSKTSFWWAPLLGALLMLTIELFLNDPTQRIEWMANVPIMMLVGAALPVIWITLFDLTIAILSPGFLRHTDTFVKRNLGPFGVGVVGLFTVTVWALIYSSVVLFPTNKVRGAVQILFCLATLLLLIPVIGNIAKQYIGSETHRNQSRRTSDEANLNRPDPWFLSILFDKLDERYALTVMATFMLPVQFVISLFFH